MAMNYMQAELGKNPALKNQLQVVADFELI
jgi:hypothetical protein